VDLSIQAKNKKCVCVCVWNYHKNMLSKFTLRFA